MKAILRRLLYISILISSSLNAEILDSGDLYNSPQNYYPRISPNAQYLSYLFWNDGHQYINLVRTSDFTSFPMVLENGYRFVRMIWLTNNQFYMTLKHEGHQFNFIVKFEEGNYKLNRIESTGFLVSSLKHLENKILFAKSSKGRLFTHNLYVISIDKLIKNQFEDARKVANGIKRGIYYSYDPLTQRIISVEKKEKSNNFIYKYVDFKGSKWQTLFEKDDDSFFRPKRFINDNTLAVLTNRNTDKIVLQEYNFKTKKFGKVIYQHPNYDLRGVSFLGSGKLDYITYLEHGLPVHNYFNKDKSIFNQRLKNTFKNQQAFIVDRDDNDSKRVLYVNGSDQPGEYFLFDTDTNIAKRLFASYPALVNKRFHPSKILTVQTEDGTEIEAFLTQPTGINHDTLLVMPHGGPIGVQEHDLFNREVQYFASRGFSVLRVNFRGSAGFGKKFLNSGVGQFGKLIENDITSVVAKIQQQYNFKHMCSIGASYGAYSATMLAIRHPTLYDCVIASFGIFDLPLLYNVSNYRSSGEYTDAVARTVGSYSRALVHYSPQYLTEKLIAPILLIAGVNDDTADFEHSNRFKYMLERNQHPLESMFYKNANHGHPTWFGDQHQAAISYDFLVRYLNLDLQSNINNNAISQQVVANDYLLIAKGFADNSTLQNDPQKALLYTQKSAQLNNPKAHILLGKHYYDGLLVDKDIAKSLEYFRQGAQAGEWMAHSLLGRIYMEGESVKQNWTLADRYLRTALTLKENELNKQSLGRFYCLAPTPYNNFDRCLKLISIQDRIKMSNAEHRNAKEVLRESLTWIIMNAKLAPKELTKIKALAVKTFGITDLDVTIEEEKIGLFEYKEASRFGETGVQSLIHQTNSLNIDKESTTKFGLVFEINIPGIDSGTKTTGIIARWTKELPDGTKRVFNDKLYYGSPMEKWTFLKPVKDLKEPAKWLFEVYDLNQNRLLQQTFNVYNASKSL